MICFLTYHRILEESGADDRNVHTVSAAELDRQIGELHNRGFTEAAIGDLLASKPLPERSCILSFDGGTVDHFDTVLPLLKKRAMHAVFFVPTADLNKPGFMTNAQVRALSDAGHTIGLHSHEHKRLDQCDTEEIQRQILLCQGILRDLIGTAPWIFAPPGGFINGEVRQLAADAGVRAIRTMRPGGNRNVNLMDLESIPVNRNIGAREFSQLIESEPGSLASAFKELVKKFVP